MKIYHSPLLGLTRGQSIVLDGRTLQSRSDIRAYVMNAGQLRHFAQVESIGPDWMPQDHVIRLSESTPLAWFQVYTPGEWVVVVEHASSIVLPSLLVDHGTCKVRHTWIYSTTADFKLKLPSMMETSHQPDAEEDAWNV